jgi:hypothetical protein
VAPALGRDARPAGAIATALAVAVLLEAWAIVRLQGRLARLENRFESHDHDDLEWLAKKALRRRTGGMLVVPDLQPRAEVPAGALTWPIPDDTRRCRDWQSRHHFVSGGIQGSRKMAFQSYVHSGSW